jgi:hypothetical protein
VAVPSGGDQGSVDLGGVARATRTDKFWLAALSTPLRLANLE